MFNPAKNAIRFCCVFFVFLVLNIKLMKKIILALFIFCCVQLNASPYNGEIQEFKQPNGAMVEVKLYGTEYYMRAEGLDGFTVVRDNNGWICYAKLSQDETELISTGIHYNGKQNDVTSLRTDLKLLKHIDISDEARNEQIKKNYNALNKGKPEEDGDHLFGKAMTTPQGLISGNIKGLCIVVDFSDEPGTLPISEFVNFCNQMNYTNFGNNGSLRKFYSDVSGGLLDYQNVVYGYYTAPLTFAAYDAMPYAQGAQIILDSALKWIDGLGFNFSTLSINTNGTIRAINLMYTGNPPNWSQGMWHHKGYFGGFSADGVTSGDYNCSPAGSPLKLAVVAHENGHMIGKWPDTYKYTSTTGVDGIGAFDLMCSYGNSYNPTPPNPLFKVNAGWMAAVDVTGYNGPNVDTANSLVCYKYKNINDTNEFFLFENRTKTGRSTYIPDQGLTVWHINRLGDNQTFNHEVYLEHANNNNNNHSAACYKQTFAPVFSSTTTPNSNFYNTNPSGLKIWNIGPVGNILNYNIGNFPAGPSLFLSYVNFTGDNNANGFLEASESANVNVNALNLGQLNSAAATITCTAIGPNAGYVTVNTAPLNVGVINVNQTVPGAFNISIAPNTPAVEIELKFTISDGTSSIFITKKITIGIIIAMTNQSVTVCDATYLDPQGENNYNDNLTNTQTFYPATPGQKLKATFTAFALEQETNCGYDYLRIYDGPNTSAPYLGAYCGTVSPGTKTSTHATGALTFKFHSDNGVTDIGFKAILSCVSVITGINTFSNGKEVKVYPNPAKDVLNIEMDETENAKFELYNCYGALVLQTNLKDNKQVDIKNLASGVYFYAIEKNGSTVTNKLIVLN